MKKDEYDRMRNYVEQTRLIAEGRMDLEMVAIISTMLSGSFGSTNI